MADSPRPTIAVVFCRPDSDDIQVALFDDLDEAHEFVNGPPDDDSAASPVPAVDEKDNCKDCKAVIVKIVDDCRTNPGKLDVEYHT